MNENVLETEGLGKAYGSSAALYDCSMTIERGQIYGLIGENGAGKTTLMKLICGQSVPTAGQVRLFGATSPKALEENRMRIGYTLETPVFYPHLTGAKNLKIHCLKKGLPDNGHVDEVLSLVGLDHARKKKFSQYSLGMKQRLGLALALISNPEFLVLDEPINGLDPVGVVQIRELLIRLNREHGVTILLSSHLLKELDAVATHFGFLHQGKLMHQLSAKELKQQCDNRLRLQVSDTLKACAILEKLCGCTDYKVLQDNVIECYELLDHPEQINRELVSNGVDVFSLSVQGKDLEEYFMEMMGGAEG